MIGTVIIKKFLKDCALFIIKKLHLKFLEKRLSDEE